MKKLTTFGLVALATLALTSGCTLDMADSVPDNAITAEDESTHETSDQAAAASGDAAQAQTPGLAELPEPPVCGDGFVADGESCDDGNGDSGDGCDSDCVIEHAYQCDGSPSHCADVCGDGLRSNLETCDDGNLVDGDGCSSDCTPELGSECGDGVVLYALEECDDGNLVNGDGCDADCTVEPGFDCYADAAHEGSQCHHEPCLDVEGNEVDCDG